MSRIFSIIISIALLVTLTAGSFFYYAYLSISEITAKNEAHFSLAEKNTKLETIRLAKKGFNTHNDEIWHNGHLYDISSYRIVGDTVLVSVLHDSNEEAIVSVIKDYFGSTNDRLANAGDHFSSKHCHNPNDIKCLCEGIKIPLITYSETSMAYLFVEPPTCCRNSSIDIPPPRI